LSSDLSRLLRRLRPHQQLKPPLPRSKKQLDYLHRVAAVPKLLYDSTVYIDLLQDRFPRSLEGLLKAADSWHSTVTEAELVALCGLLRPDHPETASVVATITASIESRQEYRILTPDREVWAAAGLLSAILSRLQQRSRTDRILLLNDALLLETARKHGLAVLTRNVKDFDLLQQLEPTARVLFYDTTES
jgi:predicted nucleic acid-binding protein